MQYSSSNLSTFFKKFKTFFFSLKYTLGYQKLYSVSGIVKKKCFLCPICCNVEAFSGQVGQSDLARETLN